MSSLYLDPEDLINLIAEKAEFKQEQIHFHITYYEGIAKIHKKNEAILALAACALLSRKLQISQQIIRNYNDSSNTYLNYLQNFLLGLISEHQENPENAINYYLAADQMPQFSVKKPFLLKVRLLNSLILTNNYSQADEYFSINSVIPIDYQEVFYLQLAYCCENLGKTSKAIQWFQKLANTDTPETQAASIWCSILQGHEKLSEIEEKIEAKPENKNILCDWKFILSQYFINKGELSKALEILKEIAEVSQKNVYFNALGVVYFKLKNFIQAFVSFLRAVKLNKAAPENWFNLALVYYRVNQTESLEVLNRMKNIDKLERLNRELDESSNVILQKFNFSQFGKSPVVKKNVKTQQKTVKKVKNVEERPQELIVPTAVTQALPMPFQTLPMNAFYENFLRFWSTSLQGRPFIGFPNGPNIFENRPTQLIPETNADPILPKKRTRGKNNGNK